MEGSRMVIEGDPSILRGGERDVHDSRYCRDVCRTGGYCMMSVTASLSFPSRALAIVFVGQYITGWNAVLNGGSRTIWLVSFDKKEKRCLCRRRREIS